MISPDAPQRQPTSVILKGTSLQGPIKFEIPVVRVTEPGQTIHQLAARKAVGELEEGRGWLVHARNSTGNLLKDTKFVHTQTSSHFDRIVEREAVRLGVKYQVGGKFCSFVAVDEGKFTVKFENTVKFGNTIQSGNTPSLFSQARYKQRINYSGSFPTSESRANSLLSAGPAVARFTSFGGGPPGGSTATGRGRGGGDGLSGWGGRSGHSSRAQPSAAPAFRSGDGTLRGATSSEECPGIETGRGATHGGPPLSVPPSQVLSESGDSDDDRGFGYFEGGPPTPALSIATASRGSDSNARDTLNIIISLQRFQGFWELEQALLAVCGVAKSASAGTLPADASRQRIVATVLAITFLERKMADERDTWELIVDKAKGWLDGLGIKMEDEVVTEPLKDLLAGI